MRDRPKDLSAIYFIWSVGNNTESNSLNNFAITSKGIGDALQKSASALVEGGNTIDEAIALVTGANSVVQNPEVVGTALKTLSLRLRGAKVELEEAGEETDGMATSVSQLQKKLLALTNGKVNIMLDANTFKNTTQILREMSTVWEDMTDIQQAAALELMGGKRQANILSSIISNFQTVEDVIKTSANSAGSAIKENEKYLDSIQGKIDQFTNALQTMWMNFISSDVIKLIVDFGTNVLDLVGDLGLLKTLLLGFAAFNGFKGILNILDLKEFSKLIKDICANGEILDANNQKIAAGLLKETIATNLAKSSLVQYAITAKLVTAEQVAQMTTTELLGTAMLGLAAKIKTVTIAMAKFLFTTPIGQMILLTGAIIGAVAAYKEWGPTLENHIKKLDESKKRYDDIKQNINDLNSELRTTQDRMKELNKLDNLSFAEEEELKTLQQTNNELERKIHLEELLLELENKEKNKEYVKTMEGSAQEKVSLPGVSGGIEKSKYANSLLGSYQEYKKQYEQASDEYAKALESGSTKNAEKAKKDMDQAEKMMDLTASQLKEYYDEWSEYAKDVDYIPNPTTKDQKAVNTWLDFYNNFGDHLAIILDEQGTAAANAFNRVISKAEFQDELEMLRDDANLTGESLRDMLTFDEDGNLIKSDGDLNHFIQTLIDCGFISGTTTEDLQRVVDAIIKIGTTANGVNATDSIKAVGQAYSILSASVERYAELNDILNEITYDNIEITEEQYNTLKELIGSEEEFNECIDTSNGYIVTNTELLNKLIKSNKKDAAANVKLSRTQARLRYYDLYKKMHKLTNGQNQLTGAALDEVNALYDQMSAIEKTIAKYSLLEAKLLGVTNVYTDLALAQAADEEMDYGSKAEELVNVLANAFNTAELGTEAAQVAISGLIPDDVIDKTKTLDEQMQQIYKYFTSGKLTKLFTIKFDDDGSIESVEMTKKNIESFVNELLKTELPDDLGTIFEGSWDEFTLNPAITSLRQFAEACGLTEEVAFSFLTSLEKYDISWLGDDFSTLLDQLMDDDLEYQLYNKMQRIADLEVKMANGTITSEEQSTYGKLIGEMEILEEQAVTNVTKYAELSGQLDDTKQEMIDLNKELENTEEGSEAYKSLEKKIKDAQEEASKLVKDMEDLGEPTELTLEVALDEAQEQIDEFKSGLNQWAKDNGKNKQIVVKINAVIDTIDSTGIEELGLTKNEDGTWSGLANIKGYSELDEESKAKVVEYLNLINSKHTIDALMGNGIITVEQHLERIVEILEETYRLTVEAKVDDEEVVTFYDWLKNTPFAKTVTFTAKKIGSWLGFGGDDSSDDNDSGSGGGGSSGGFANGTAHATGSWGASKTETALVGELGPEMVVRNGRWFTVGENGAEFTGVKKGDIIFNHKQTESLLKNGYVTSRGKAFASGIGNDSLNLSIKEELKYYQELIKKRQKYAETLSQEERYWGNVDEYSRNILIVTDKLVNELKEKDLIGQFETKDSVGEYMTTFGMQDRINNGSLAGQQILYTPILPNGKLLNKDTINQYISEITKDALNENDVLSADKKGLMIGNTFVNGIINGVTNVDDNLINSILDPIFNSIDESKISNYNDSINTLITDAIINAFDISDSDEINEISNVVSSILDDIIKNANPSKNIKDLIYENSMDIISIVQGIHDSFTQHAYQAGIYDEEYNSLVKLQDLYEQNGMSLDDLVNKLDNLKIEASVPVEATPIEQTIDIKANVDEQSIWDKISRIFSSITKKISSWFNGLFGGTNISVNGTAHASGNWGTKKNETALVGELGQELIVDPKSGTWHTVGDNGAEFTNVPRGSIIFNHKQTEDLLSKGYITGRGRSYASGTAYAGINTWDDAYNKVSKDYGNKGSKGSDDDIKDEVKEVVDFIEIKLEEIEAIISKTSAKLELLRDDTSQTKYKDQMYNQLIQAEKNKANTYLQAYNEYNKRASDLLKKVPEKYRNLAKNGGIKIEDFIDKGESDANAKIVEAINDYREWATKADEVETGYYESLQQQAAYRLQQIEDIADDFENLVQVINTESTLLQSEMDLVTESGGRLSENHYNRLIELKEAELDRKEKEKKQLQKELNNALAEGTIEYGTDEWYQAIDLIASVDDEIVQCQIDMEKFSNEAQNIQWDNLDRLIERFDTLDSQISHLYDRFTDNDKVVDDKGNWTNEGIAAMGMLVQQMEIAKVKSDQYADAIKQLNKDYKKGLYSPDEYNEKLAELTEQQWESIEAYEDAKDSLVDLNKTRIDAVKDGMQKEIDAYKELIDKKKESLDADKNAYDFEKNVQKQTKNIQAIERKIAALRGDTSMSAAAQRKELEAELLEAKAELEDTFYERSVENQKDALDNEYENYEKSMNKEMEALDEYLENSEQVVLDSINTVKNNASIVLQEIKEISRQYGIDISNSIADPWRDGSNAISDYQEGFKNLSSSFIEELDKIIAQEEELQKSADRAAKALAKTVNQTVQEYTKEPAKKPDKSSPSEQAKQPTLPTKPDTSKEESKKSVEKAPPTKGDKVTVKKTATHFSSKSGSKKMASFVPGSTYTVYQVSGSQVLIGRNGEYTGWVNLKDLQGYAKGTTGVKNDQFAWIDEVGEELILHAGNDGKLTYLSKGTSVIPSDITNKLLDLVVDPTQTLENSRPIISAPHIVNNEITIDASIGEVIHIDSVSNDTLPNLEKVVEKQMDKYVKNLNNQIRKYSR